MPRVQETAPLQRMGHPQHNRGCSSVILNAAMWLHMLLRERLSRVIVGQLGCWARRSAVWNIPVALDIPPIAMPQRFLDRCLVVGDCVIAVLVP